MKKFTLISPPSYGSGLPLAGVSCKQGTTFSPPQSLMDFSPLSQLTNHIIAGLNELKQCAAIGVSASVHHQLVVVMECVIHELFEYHRCVLYMLCNDVCMYSSVCVCVCSHLHITYMSNSACILVRHYVCMCTHTVQHQYSYRVVNACHVLCHMCGFFMRQNIHKLYKKYTFCEKYLRL